MAYNIGKVSVCVPCKDEKGTGIIYHSITIVPESEVNGTYGVCPISYSVNGTDFVYKEVGIFNYGLAQITCRWEVDEETGCETDNFSIDVITFEE